MILEYIRYRIPESQEGE
ncbi:hypothetical protein, partial [Frankia sp. AvcI1]